MRQINLAALLTHNSDSSPETEPAESSPEIEEPPTQRTPTVSSPYQRIAGFQRQTPSPAIPTLRPTPPTGIFRTTSPPPLTPNPPVESLTSISISPEDPPIPERTSFPEPPRATYARATSEERRALVANYLRDHPDPELNDPEPIELDENDEMPELKAGLPGNFSGTEEDANLWLLQMKAYFALNPSLYQEKNKILAFLNKVDKGRGKSFSEGWLITCANPNVKDEDRTFDKIEADFVEKFIPTDRASRSRHSLSTMKMEDPPFNGDFHKFKSEFEIEVACSGVTNKHILIDLLGKAVSANLAFKMTALQEEPTSHKQWLHKAGQFFDATLRMKKLRSGQGYTPAHSRPKKSSQDPMAMDVDRIYLSPTQRAKHIRNNKCFICHKVRCSTRNHPGIRNTPPPYRPPNKTYLPRNQRQHNVQNTNTTEVPTTKPIDEVEAYLNIVQSNRNLSNQDVLKSLQIIFDDSVDEQGEQINTIHLNQIPPKEDF